MSSRTLDLAELERLAKREATIDEEWPGLDNLNLIAHAVNHRRQFVDLKSSSTVRGAKERFSIKYDQRARAVYLKPANGDNAPCGWFAYDELKGVLNG